MKISKLIADDAILTELGKRLAQRRLSLQLTQADVAEEAGVAKRTIERIEAGHSAQMSSIIRMLRALDGLPGLDSVISESGPRPMDQVKRKGKVRQRASKRGRSKLSGKPWTWDDES